MRKRHSVTNGANQLFNVNFHDFISKEQNNTSMELASEFGISRCKAFKEAD